MALPRLRGYRLTAAACGLAVTAAALVSGSGVLADATPSTPQVVRAQLAYTCRFPAGSRPVSVTVAGTFPPIAVAGQPIKPSGLRTTVAIPPATVAYLRRLGVTGVTGREVLSAAVANNAKQVTAQWPGAVRETAPVPASNRMNLTFSGAMPPVIASTPGTVTFTASGLTLVLIPHTANAVADSPAVHAIPATCAPTGITGVRLATVPVQAAPTPPSHSGSVRRAKGLVSATGGGVPKGCAKLLVHGAPNPVLGCAFLLGYADVLKLQEAALLGPGPGGAPPAAFLHVDTYESDIGCVPTQPTLAACINHHGVVHAYSCSVAQLDYHKQLAFPPAKVTFLNFQFVPVTAVMQVSETAWPRSHPPTENRKCYQGFNKLTPVPLKSPVVSVFTDLSDDILAKLPVLNVSETYLAIHISQVAVNGVPLNVGSRCGTSQPVHAVLTGRGHNGPPPTGYTLATGGPLAGSVTIPKFAHCGVGENLDPLFNASISGPMNFQLMTQGTLCTPQQAGQPGCPPTVPKPRRQVGKS
jgi:hypothetical protein